MSIFSLQTQTFYYEVTKSGRAFTVKDKLGYPAPKNGQGSRTMPFWSSKSRVEKIVEAVPAYYGFSIEEITLEKFLNYWLLELEKSSQLVGLNWSGERATGFDFEPQKVRATLEKVGENK